MARGALIRIAYSRFSHALALGTEEMEVFRWDAPVGPELAPPALRRRAFGAHERGLFTYLSKNGLHNVGVIADPFLKGPIDQGFEGRHQSKEFRLAEKTQCSSDFQTCRHCGPAALPLVDGDHWYLQFQRELNDCRLTHVQGGQCGPGKRGAGPQRRGSRS